MINLIIDSSKFSIPKSNFSLDFVRLKCLVGFKEKESTNYRRNSSSEMIISSYFAQIDEIPIILGFADLLIKFKIKIDYQKGIAFLE